MLGCCSSNESQGVKSPQGTVFTDTTGPRTVQRFNIVTISAIIESVAVVDTANYRLYVRIASTNAAGEESITAGQLMVVIPHYVYNDHSLIDWSIDINNKLRSLRNIHPGSPLEGRVMINQRQQWLLVGVE